MSEPPDTIKHLHALASHPTTPEHERAAAQRKLDALLKKYNITIEDVSGDQAAWRTFPFKTGWECQLLIQIAAMLLDIHRVPTQKEKGVIRFNVTIATRTDVFEAFNYYQPMLAEQYEANRQKTLEARREAKRTIESLQAQRKILGTAFFNHFDIFPKTKSTKTRKLNNEEAEAVYNARTNFEGERWEPKHGKLGDQLALGNGETFKLEN